MRVKVNDTVEVIAGNDKGSRGKVLTVNKKTGKVVVEGMNLVYKHVRRSQKNPQGGRLSKEMPIQVSNVMVVCEKCSSPSRTGYRTSRMGARNAFVRNVAGPMAKSPLQKQHTQKSRQSRKRPASFER